MRARKMLAAVTGLVLVLAGGAVAAGEPPFGHWVPADKKLPEAWVRALSEKGAAAVWRGKALDGVGMPCGGIAAGQLYLRGDGTLTFWHLFNREQNSGYGAGSYQHPLPATTVGQGFAVVVEAAGKTAARRLSKEGFEDIAFLGEYPIGLVRYAAKDFPVRVELEAFSPFIPLNASDSGLPATLFHVTVTNASQAPVQARVLGWLQNAVLHDSARMVQALRRTRRVDTAGRSLLVHSAEPAPPPKPEEKPRPTIVLADFEGPTYGDWKVEGPALGTAPAQGTLQGQQPVTGFLGKGLVNTFLGGDRPQGTLTSPPFAVVRRTLLFLIGGGSHAGETCVNLLVDGKGVRTAVGRGVEQLTWHSWDVRDLAGKQAVLQIVDKASGPWGHINVDQIELADTVRGGPSGPVDRLPDCGTMALALAASAASTEETRQVLAALGPVGQGLEPAADAVYPAGEPHQPALLSPALALAPGAKQTATFVLTWHFPNYGSHGRRYAARFKDAPTVAAYVLDNHDRLAGETHLWHDTYYDSTLPHWLLDRLHYPVANLATETVQWWANGRFWAWEGVGCCAGTCTHVWNYAHALARLFPELERSAREMQDFGVALQPSGVVGFRGNDAYAADGQCGTILKAYREHRMSADDSFLRRNWPQIKRALQFSIERDGDGDGLIEDSQHNTYDINFFGPNTFVGSLYLAALRAGEEMAREMGDDGFAAQCRRIFESGRLRTVEKLWNGEYFIQLVDLQQHPKHQYATGCLADQLFGQGWAHQLGLGYLYPAEHVQTALKSIWKYNWAPDVGPQNAAHPPQRWFARPGEPGLFTCTWPKSPHLGPESVLYRDEIWTGIEYQVAGHMVWDGLLTEGLAIVRGVHDRYQPTNHDPYNEVECGDHYARALASWGVYLALAGTEYHGPKGHLTFAPRLAPDDFRAAFTAAEGWGTFAQKRAGNRQDCRMDLQWGSLRLTRLAVALPDGVKQANATVKVAGQAGAAQATVADGRLVLTFPEPLRLPRGQSLEVAATW